MLRGNFRYFIEVIFAMIFWSLSFIWIKLAYITYLPITTIFFRVVIASIILLIFGLALKKLQLPAKKDLKWMFLLGFFEPFIYFLGESYGLVYLSATTAAVIISIVPLITPVFSSIFYHEKINLITGLGIAISFIGTYWLLTGFSFHLEYSLKGILLELLAVLSTLGFSLCLKKLTSNYNNFSIVCYQNLIGTVLFFPLWVLLEARQTIQTPFNFHSMMAIIELAIFATILAFFFFTDGIRHLGINYTNLFTNLIPLGVAILSFFMLKDKYTMQQITGIITVIIGLFIACIRSEKDTVPKFSNKRIRKIHQ